MYGSISGTVTDATGAAIPGAKANLSSPDNRNKRASISGQDGSFSLANLPSGTYQLQITSTGFAPYRNTSVSVAVGRNVRVDVRLNPASANQQVNVQALDTSQTSPVTNIDRDRIEELQKGRRLNNHAPHSCIGHAARKRERKPMQQVLIRLRNRQSRAKPRQDRIVPPDCLRQLATVQQIALTDRNAIAKRLQPLHRANKARHRMAPLHRLPDNLQPSAFSRSQHYQLHRALLLITDFVFEIEALLGDASAEKENLRSQGRAQYDTASTASVINGSGERSNPSPESR